MKMRSLLAAVILVGISAIIASQTFSQEKATTPSQPTPNEEEMMAIYMKYAQPGDRHKALDPMAGNWDLVFRFWADPSAPPQESKGACEAHWILGGRFLEEDVEGVMNGMPIHGMSIMGYDNYRQQYNYVWVDEMATSFMLATGRPDETGKIVTLKGTFDNPATGAKDLPFRVVNRIVGNDQRVYEMYLIGKDGKEFKNFEIIYTRKK